MSTRILETFVNPAPQRDYTITHSCSEFTSVCPKTGQPDFGSIDLEYIPDALCIELKSLKLYYHSFRSEGIFYEAVVNRIIDDLAAACTPRWMRVTGSFNVRGGISSVVVAEFGGRAPSKNGGSAKG
ncbi:MAG: preQ(1) synthase [Fimbriimonadaceae bacterium]